METSATIPFFDFGGSGELVHFAHANGYPPDAYRHLFELLTSNYHVVAMAMRPLWAQFSPAEFKNWLVLSDDLEQFLKEHQHHHIIGIGHSMGATTTLRLALDKPGYFSRIILIDPVIFPPNIIHLWNIVCFFALENQFHPLAKSTRKRRKFFHNKQEMFNNYRSKLVFRNIPDNILWDYVNSIALETQDRLITLAYSPEWEAQIYTTGLKADMSIWEKLPHLSIPILIIRGEFSNTFWNSTANKIQKIHPRVLIQSITKSGHLAPLERPDVVCQEINRFLSTQSSISN